MLSKRTHSPPSPPPPDTRVIRCLSVQHKAVKWDYEETCAVTLMPTSPAAQGLENPPFLGLKVSPALHSRVGVRKEDDKIHAVVKLPIRPLTPAGLS